jgi:glycosyltransferase involved in cell wall biosynthesis
MRPNASFFSSLGAVTVSDERGLRRLRAWGLNNSFLVHPGIETARFTCSPTPLGSELRLMVGSAPWTRRQFRTKGIEALLLAAQREPRLRLVFLWRGVLADEMERRVRRLGLEQRVTVLNQQVDVNRVLAGVHASIALTTNSAIVKAYPQSLLESLAAGKPVLISRAVAMSDYVERTDCGKVVENATPADILAAMEALRAEYPVLQKSAQQVGQRDFSQQAMIQSFQKVYERVL